MGERGGLTRGLSLRLPGLEAASLRYRAIIGLSAVGLAFLLAALGQTSITRYVRGKADWIGALADPLRGIYVDPKSVMLGAILLAAGALVFVLATSRREEDRLASSQGALDLRSWLAAGRSPWLAVGLAGLGLWAYLLLRLNGDSYEEYYPHLLMLALLLMAAFLWRWDRRLRVPLGLRVHAWELGFLGAAVGLFVGLNVRDLDNWRYSAIGDEYAFFDLAKRIASGVPTNLFSAHGVYDFRPVGSSALQAVTMNLFGEDQFGWKMSNVVVVSATLPALYFLTRQLFHWGVAVVATATLAFSHYVFAYTHTGYDNLLVILPSVLALALLVPGLKRSSSLLLFSAGAVAGLSAYAYPSARMAPLAMVVFLLTLGWRKWRVQTLLPLGLGALMAVIPILVVSGEEFWTNMSDRSVFGFTDSPTEGVGRRILENIPRTLFIFNFSPGHSDHYVSGSILDPVSAVFYVMGLAVALTRFRHHSYRLLLLWLGLGLLASGIFSPYDRPAEDRVQFDMPAVAIVVGIGAYEAFRHVAALSPAKAARYVMPVCLAGLLPTVLVLNSLRFWVETPGSTPTSVESVVARAAFSSECNDAGGRTVVIAPEPVPVLEPLFRSYNLGDRSPLLLRFEEALQRPSLGTSGCLILAGLHDQRAQILQSRIKTQYPERSEYALQDYSGQRQVLVYR